ncbi:MAG: hypothetical protein AAGK00_00545 [Pseudomonadota bacterium]
MKDNNGVADTGHSKNTNRAPYKALTLDIERYQQMLDCPDLTDTQRREFIGALWSIICFFVERGYQVQPEESCGQDAELPVLEGIAASDLVDSDDSTITRTFETSAAAADQLEES